MMDLVLNTIKTDEAYMAEGFTMEEVPMIRRHDQLFNQEQINGFLKPRKEAEMMELQRRLGI